MRATLVREAKALYEGELLETVVHLSLGTCRFHAVRFLQISPADICSYMYSC